ncbi:MAG TPA: CcmD family protein [Gemmatimonadaceae bacterium]|jgi:CcmD family protein|nr:CcmD family protein [Gemmatimonadaceae bacterium]
MREWRVVIAAYAIVWIAFGSYAYYLARRARRAASTLEGSAGALR